MARSELWCTLPAPPLPDLNVLGCLASAEARGAEVEVVKGFEVEVAFAMFPAPPRAVWTYGEVAFG